MSRRVVDAQQQIIIIISCVQSFSLYMEAISSLDAPQWDGTCFRIVINTDKSAVWMNYLVLVVFMQENTRPDTQSRKISVLF
jgi:hypothetical protein